MTLFKWQELFLWGTFGEKGGREETTDDRKTLRPARCNYIAIFSSMELRKMLNCAHAV